MNTESLLHRIHDAIANVLAECGADARTSFIRAASLPPDGEVVEIEASDPEVAHLVVRDLGLVGEEAERVQIVPLPRPGTPLELYAVSSVVDVRRSPSHTSELVTQIICGDRVDLLVVEGEWYLARVDDGYIGWIRSWHLGEIPGDHVAAFGERAGHRVAVNHAELLGAPEAGALPVTDLVIGTRVALAPGSRRGWRAAELLDGRRGYIRSSAVEKLNPRRRVSRERLAATGLRFLGIPYLWGGTTPKGFDCSGLIQRIFRLNGVLLPRDSDMQAAHGSDKTAEGPDGLAPGDLLFFGRSAHRVTHVAMVLPDRLFLHAFGQVRVNSLDPSHPLFAPDLARDWRLARDPLANPGLRSRR